MIIENEIFDWGNSFLDVITEREMVEIINIENELEYYNLKSRKDYIKKTVAQKKLRLEIGDKTKSCLKKVTRVVKKLT